jgi:hypothetical protein
MGKIREGYHIISRKEGLAHIENYYRSGLRPAEYYKSNGLTECQFYGWRKRYLTLHPESSDKNTAVKSRKKFHPIKIESSRSLRLSGLEIHYPNGVRVVVDSEHAIETDQLKELIKLRV